MSDEKYAYARKAYIERGDSLNSLAKGLELSPFKLRKVYNKEQWRMQRARFLIAERHRLATDEGIDFSKADQKTGPKVNELHDLCLTLFWEKDMGVKHISDLTGVAYGTVNRWKSMECWEEQKKLLKEEQGEQQVPDDMKDVEVSDDDDSPDYRDTIARHLFVKQRLSLPDISDITGLEIPRLQQLKKAGQWMKELAAHQPRENARSLNEELRNAAQSLQIFLARECQILAKSSADYDRGMFDAFSRTVKSVDHLVNQFAILDVSIVQDVISGLIDDCIQDVGKGALSIADMNTVFKVTRDHCDRKLNAIRPDDSYYDIFDERSSERGSSPSPAHERQGSASPSARAATSTGSVTGEGELFPELVEGNELEV